MANKSLQINQLEQKMKTFALNKREEMPNNGWIKAIRTALGMSMQQLGNKLSISKQSIQEIEKREKDGAITIKSLREVAKALDMQVVYVLVPNDGSLHALIERKSLEIATKIVMRTSNTMKLEDQENSQQRIKKAIQERAAIIRNESPKILWD
jgi:predicted DNA-binding mobile mystery protein A